MISGLSSFFSLSSASQPGNGISFSFAWCFSIAFNTLLMVFSSKEVFRFISAFSASLMLLKEYPASFNLSSTSSLRPAAFSFLVLCAANDLKPSLMKYDMVAPYSGFFLLNEAPPSLLVPPIIGVYCNAFLGSNSTSLFNFSSEKFRKGLKSSST